MSQNQANQTWWYNYRTVKRKPRPKMTVEMIIRKACGATLKEYIDNCSVPGIRQMCEQRASRIERLIYVILFCAMFCIILYSLYHVWVGTLKNPLIITMESATYSISLIDFPAVALCNINRISKKALTIAAKESPLYLSLMNESMLKDVEWFYLQSGRLIDYTYDPALGNHPFLDAIPTLTQDTWDIIDNMRYLVPKCEDMLLKCAWGGEMVNCTSIFTLRRTVHGHCCAFNYVLGLDTNENPNQLIASVKRQTQPGPSSGLTVFLDPVVDDYAYPLYNMVGIEVLIFDPTHFADPTSGRVIQRNVQPDHAVYFEIQSTKQIATQEVRKYPYSTRKCLFHDESKEYFGNMYSYSACIVNCRIKTVQSLCKCTPFYLRTEQPHPTAICTINDLKCLNKYKEKLLYIYPKDAVSIEGLETEIQESLYCPDCIPDCELTQHFTKFSKIPLNDQTWKHKYLKDSFFGRLNLTKRSLLSIYQSTSDGVLNRLDVVSYWFEILSNVGGFCGVLLGISIISLFELTYYWLTQFPTKAIQFYLNDK